MKKNNINKLYNNVDKYEKLSFYFIFMFIVLIIFVQGIHLSPFSKKIVKNYTILEGTPLKTEENLYNKGLITIKAEGTNIDKLKILINCEEVGKFDTDMVTIPVKEFDVLELDGRLLDENIKVSIQDKSKNMILEGYILPLYIQSGVKVLSKIRFVK